MKYHRFLKNISEEAIRDFTSFGNPFLLLIISAMFVGITTRLSYIALGLLSIEVLCWIIKYFYYKKRPKEEAHSNIPERINAGSFPSLHSARSSFVFVSLFMLTDNLIFKILFITLIAIVGLTRILLRKHYLSDIIAGYVIGILTSITLKFLGFLK